MQWNCTVHSSHSTSTRRDGAGASSRTHGAFVSLIATLVLIGQGCERPPTLSPGPGNRPVVSPIIGVAFDEPRVLFDPPDRMFDASPEIVAGPGGRACVVWLRASLLDKNTPDPVRIFDQLQVWGALVDVSGLTVEALGQASPDDVRVLELCAAWDTGRGAIIGYASKSGLELKCLSPDGSFSLIGRFEGPKKPRSSRLRRPLLARTSSGVLLVYAHEEDPLAIFAVSLQHATDGSSLEGNSWRLHGVDDEMPAALCNFRDDEALIVASSSNESRQFETQATIFRFRGDLAVLARMKIGWRAKAPLQRTDRPGLSPGQWSAVENSRNDADCSGNAGTVALLWIEPDGDRDALTLKIAQPDALSSAYMHPVADAAPGDLAFARVYMENTMVHCTWMVRKEAETWEVWYALAAWHPSAGLSWVIKQTLGEARFGGYPGSRRGFAVIGDTVLTCWPSLVNGRQSIVFARGQLQR